MGKQVTKADQARAKVQSDEAEAKAKKAEVKRRKEMAIPEFKDPEGEMKKLKGSDFPSTRAGRLSWCDYNIAKWGVKKLQEGVKSDPKAKLKKKREKLMAMLADLDEELDVEDSAEIAV